MTSKNILAIVVEGQLVLNIDKNSKLRGYKQYSKRSFINSQGGPRRKRHAFFGRRQG